jgi:hypothetical protein
MPIRSLLDDSAFRPHEIEEMAAAFEATLAALKLVDRADPLTILIARTIIECAKCGEIDRARLRDCAIEAMS